MIRKCPQPQKALFHPGSVPKLSPYPKSQYVKPPKMTSTAFLTIMLTSFLLVTDPLSSRPKPGEKRILVISWWRHQVETFSALLALLLGIHRWQVNFPHKGQWRGALMFYLICAWINGEYTIVRLVILDAIAPIMTPVDSHLKGQLRDFDVFFDLRLNARLIIIIVTHVTWDIMALGVMKWSHPKHVTTFFVM